MSHPEVDWSIYLVTDPDQCARMGRTVPEVAGLAAQAGATVVQVRAKDADGGVFLSEVLACAETLAGTGTTLIVNDRVDVFLAARSRLTGSTAQVHGVHVGQSDLPAEDVRALIGPDALLGLSTNTVDQVRAANHSLARIDLQGIGPYKATATKVEADYGIGVSGIADFVATATTPTVAIGGVNAADIPALKATGVTGIAVVSAICLAEDPAKATQALVAAWSADHP